ncbi:MAG: SDR family oxidoreductase [Chlorobiales bacterium]
MKTIVIFGATSAIAKAVARIYAKEGNALFLVGRNEEQTQTLASDLKVRGAKEVLYAVADLAKLDQHPSLIATIKQTFPKIDIALIAHGVLPKQDECNQEVAKTIDAMMVNFLSPISLLTLLANEMQAQGAGTIAVISSVAGDRGRQSNYVYGAAKGGLSLFLQGLRNRLHSKGVAVITIKPGFVDTPMTAAFKKGALWAKPEQVAKGIVKAIEKRRDEVYLPAFWKWIMFIIRQIPESIFKRLSL